MKAEVIVLVIISVLLASCGAQTGTQIIEVTTEAPVTKAPATPAPATPETIATPEPVAVVTEEPIATEPPMEMPTERPLACVTLLEPVNGIDLPVTGKVTFSWTPMDKAGSYVLNFILPSGAVASIETDQTFRDRYMEAFVSGGEYQWQVIARNTDGSQICVSEVFAFDKPTYETPKTPKGGGNNGGNNESEGIPPPPSNPTGQSGT